ncbi:alpha/beta hydrolase family protein [Amycolatopsis sp. cmx-4-83]|uniref:alpha/beta hydrolase family protein n=1 Tax=Amycolatopsis sp. cmx-4-83 TaxID=2790940 RepID=UPI00397AFD67
MWNLSLNLALSQGAAIGEIDEACRPLRPDSTTEEFFTSWCMLARRLVDLADADEAQGHHLSAAERHRRASIYFLTAERMQKHGYAPRADAYRAGLDSFRTAITLGRENCEFVEIPYGGNSLPGLLVRAYGDEPQPPIVVHLNGLDSTKEMIYGTGIAREYARRGISTLIVDQPGSGESLRLRGMPGVVESERYGTACLDYLLSRGDCDPDRIGIAGWSLGGYFAPRVAAYEPRFAFCVAWGAIYDWGALQRRRQQQLAEAPAEKSVPHFWEHVLWTFGQTSLEGLAHFTARMNLVEDSRRIRMPFLVLHGSNDRQVPVEMARRQYDAAVNSVRRQLKIMTEHDGGVEHVAADNITPTTAYIADWVADVTATRSER